MSTPKEIAVEALRSIRFLAGAAPANEAAQTLAGVASDALKRIEAVEGEQEDSAGRADAPSATLPTDPVEEVVGWRPIETAPKDGKPFLAWFKDGMVESVCADEHGWWYALDGDSSDTRVPTHWMPHPIGPAISTEGEG